MDWQGLPAGRVFAVVRGRDAADVVYAALDTGSTVVIDPPRPCGSRWWLMEADATMAALDRVEAGLAEGHIGIVLVGDVAEYGVVSVFDPDTGAAKSSFGVAEPEGLLAEDRVVTRARIDTWLAAHAPKRPSQRVLTRAWADLESGRAREVAPALLKRWGWRYTSMDLRSLLEGFGGAPAPGPNWVGLRRMDWHKVRWITGEGTAADGTRFLGLWDLDAPGPPVQRWPGDHEGRDHMYGAQFEFNTRPILEGTRLEGERFWTPIQRHPESMTGDAGAVLMHWPSDKTLAVIYPAPIPITFSLGAPGRTMGPGPWAARARLEPDPFGLVTLPTRESAQRLAYAMLNPHYTDQLWDDGPTPWTLVPDDVPRDLLGTCAWIRSHTTT